MTREQALLDFTKGYCLVCEDNIPHFMEKQVTRTINKIFDDFESKTCSSCCNFSKYSHNSDGRGMCSMFNITLHRDFYCLDYKG